MSQPNSINISANSNLCWNIAVIRGDQPRDLKLFWYHPFSKHILIYSTWSASIAYLLDNPAIRDELLTKSECSELKERKNLFGLYPGDDPSKLYYVGQSYVIPQMISYLKYKNNSVVTDTETQDMKRGLCNGFSFLFNFYASQGMRLYFYSHHAYHEVCY